jgi:D-amino-acid oxidase
LMMDSSLYMPYLNDLFTTKGGTLIEQEITDIHDFLSTHPLAMNCSGLGSRTLFDDDQVFPSRGQVMRVKPMELTDAVCYNVVSEDLIFVMPRRNDVILGGTAQDNDWRTEIDQTDNERMIKDSALIGAPVPPSSVIETKVGFRPSRDAIRLEIETINGKHVIHNYGHGGGGYTLSWGCAMDVVNLVESIASPS